MIVRSFLACIALAALAACAHQRPSLDGNIAIPAKRIPANFNQQASNDVPPGQMAPVAQEVKQKILLSAFAQTVLDARHRNLTANVATCSALLASNISGDARQPMVLGNAMVLSGGSQHGSFGAGFFLGLQDKGLLQPEPEVVTGVSTGALQSTFVFLARQPVARDRDYSWVDPKALPLHSLPGADNEPPLMQGRSNLEDLALAYSISREDNILQPSKWGDAGVVTQGALARLTPLRTLLFKMVSPDTITQVATEACRGRVLMVGVTDVDDGYGYALDLTALSLKAFEGGATSSRMNDVRKTYISALLASSSVPVGAMPVTLRYREFDDDGKPDEIAARQHMFIDGGSRFGVFLPEKDDKSNVTLIVNNALNTPPWTSGNPAISTSKWTALNLALRTVNDLLESQVYQLSVGRVESAAGKLSMAYLSNQHVVGKDGKLGENPIDHVYLCRTCGQWQSEIDAKKHPLQFDPDYMACLIDYGRSRGNQAQWNLIKP